MGGQDVEYHSGQETVHPAYINAKLLRYRHRSITDEAAQLLVSLLTSHLRQVILTSIIGLIQIRDRRCRDIFHHSSSRNLDGVAGLCPNTS
jgi:hypothetical protein